MPEKKLKIKAKKYNKSGKVISENIDDLTFKNKIRRLAKKTEKAAKSKSKKSKS